MPLMYLAWLLWILFVVLGGIGTWQGKNYWYGGGNLLLAILLAVMIWHSFGPLIEGR